MVVDPPIVDLDDLVVFIARAGLAELGASDIYSHVCFPVLEDPY